MAIINCVIEEAEGNEYGRAGQKYMQSLTRELSSKHKAKVDLVYDVYPVEIESYSYLDEILARHVELTLKSLGRKNYCHGTLIEQYRLSLRRSFLSWF